MDSEKEDMRWLLVRLSPRNCSTPQKKTYRDDTMPLSAMTIYSLGGVFMKLGYSYRLSQYAFGLGLLALLLAGGIVFFLNLVTLRTERYQAQLSTRFSHAAHVTQVEEESGGVPSPSPEYSPPPETRVLTKVAARQTVAMLRPLVFYLALTGGAWVLLRGSRRLADG
jgi:hypothetical protein